LTVPPPRADSARRTNGRRAMAAERSMDHYVMADPPSPWESTQALLDFLARMSRPDRASRPEVQLAVQAVRRYLADRGVVAVAAPPRP